MCDRRCRARPRCNSRKASVVKIYVASSWRNYIQPLVVSNLLDLGHTVYDFKNPPDRSGFGWGQLGPEAHGANGTPAEFREALKHPIAQAGFASDMKALRECDVCLLVLPCNRSAHLELGWACGAGKHTAVYMPEKSEPELMYTMLDAICVRWGEVKEWLADLEVARIVEPVATDRVEAGSRCAMCGHPGASILIGRAWYCAKHGQERLGSR